MKKFMSTFAATMMLLAPFSWASSISIEGINADYKNGSTKDVRSLAHCVNQATMTMADLQDYLAKSEYAHLAIKTANDIKDGDNINRISYTFNKPIEVLSAGVEHMQISEMKYNGITLNMITSVIPARSVGTIESLLKFNNDYQINNDKRLLYRHVGNNTLILRKPEDESVAYLTCVFNTDQITTDNIAPIE